jgi:hypothetical protein
MKRSMWVMAVIVFAISGIHAMKRFQATSISGKVSPPEGVNMVWALGAKDTIKTTLKEGAFMLPIKAAGQYKVVVDAKDPFKDVVKEVTVEAGKNTDLGEIKLEQ